MLVEDETMRREDPGISSALLEWSNDMDTILSVVIANYNYGRYLEEAILSVLDSNCSEVELIVVDGGSADNSVEIIKKYSDRLAWWCSERDRGQSHAFNKGFSHAQGQFLTWLNADDYFVSGSLQHVIRALKKHKCCEWFTGNTYRFAPTGEIVEIWWGAHFLPPFLQGPDAPISVYGPSAFFSRRVYEKLGGIREDMHYMMDIDFWARMMQAGIRQRRINCFCWAFRLHQCSKTAEFDGHLLEPAARAAFEKERNDFFIRTGYHASRKTRMLTMAWRFLDGSFFVKWLISHVKRHVSK